MADCIKGNKPLRNLDNERIANLPRNRRENVLFWMLLDGRRLSFIQPDDRKASIAHPSAEPPGLTTQHE